MLDSFTSNVDCVLECGGVCTCWVLLCVLFVRLWSVHHLWWLLYFYALNNLVIYILHIEQMDESHSYDVVRQKYMLIWWMCCVYSQCIHSEHCMFRIHTRRLWFVDEKNEEEGARVSETLKFFGKSDRCVCFFARHEHVFAVNSSFFGVVLNFLAFPLPHHTRAVPSI